MNPISILYYLNSPLLIHPKQVFSQLSYQHLSLHCQSHKAIYKEQGLQMQEQICGPARILQKFSLKVFKIYNSF